MTVPIARRKFVVALAGAAAWPLAARAQQDRRVRRIGVLLPGDGLAFVPLTQALADLGWTDGRNVRIYLRGFGDDINRIRARAQELVGLQPDIILAVSTPVTIALQRETRTIPIVFASVADPVASGLVALARSPGAGFRSLAAIAMRQQHRYPQQIGRRRRPAGV
jgi:putative ABC transport system substrate-binding protein